MRLGCQLNVTHRVAAACAAIAFANLCLNLSPQQACAQVAINLGVQEIYDDNVFLEADERRPPFVVVDNIIERDVKSGRVRTVLSDEIDGKSDDDLITSLILGASGVVPVLQKYATTIAQGETNFLLFQDQTSQNRVTIDALVDTTLTEQFLPRPYYLSIINQLSGDAADANTAEGTATRATETYTLSGRTGVSGVKLSPNTDWGLGYTGSYQLFLGEFRFEEEEPGELEEEGADYHTHTASTELGYDVNPDLRVSLNGSAGATIYTNIEQDDFFIEGDEDEQSLEDEQDRATYTGTANARYQATSKMTVSGSAGVNHASRFDEPQPRTVTFFGDDGQSKNVTVTREKDETAFIGRFELDYLIDPGSQLLLGVEQNVGTDIDGERLTVRSVYGNLGKALTDQFSLNLGARFQEYSSESDLQDSTERVELSASLNYLLTQQTSLTLGYTFADQRVTSDDPEGDNISELRSNEYESNRVFVGISTGFVGLPL